jgi:hypothetical protein
MWENRLAILTGAFHISNDCGNVSGQEFSIRSVGNSIKASHISTVGLQHKTCGQLKELSTNQIVFVRLGGWLSLLAHQPNAVKKV